MNRRELLSGMLAFPLLGTVARGIAGPLSAPTVSRTAWRRDYSTPGRRA